jgi:tetratricopeptide (TPR) repeat protein
MEYLETTSHGMNDPLISWTFHELSNAYCKRNNHETSVRETSIRYLKKWLEARPTGYNTVSDNVEDLCLALQDDDLALEYYRTVGMKHSTLPKDKLFIATTNFKMSKLLQSQKKYAAALSRAKIALKIAEKLNDSSKEVYKKQVKELKKLVE